MQIPILVESVAGDGYRARGGEPLALSAEGATREEALSKLRELIRQRLNTGAEIVSLELPVKDNPWLQMAGMINLEDPLVKEWIQIMEENRREADQDPDGL